MGRTENTEWKQRSSYTIQEEDMFVGWFEEYPDYRTQDETIEELKENLVDIHHGTVGSYHC